MSGAHVSLVGRVTLPGELRYASTGKAMLGIGVLVHDRTRREGDPPDFANVTAWGQTAESLAGHIEKGTMLKVEGRGRARAWIGQDGQPRATLDVSAWNVELIGNSRRSAPRQPDDKTTTPSGPMPETVAVTNGGGAQRQMEESEGDAEIPF